MFFLKIHICFISNHDCIESFSPELSSDTQTILTIQNHVITKNHRISILHSEHKTWQLKIKDIRESDRGFYMCQMNTDPMKSQTGYLDVVGMNKNLLKFALVIFVLHFFVHQSEWIWYTNLCHSFSFLLKFCARTKHIQAAQSKHVTGFIVRRFLY